MEGVVHTKEASLTIGETKEFTTEKKKKPNEFVAGDSVWVKQRKGYHEATVMDGCVDERDNIRVKWKDTRAFCSVPVSTVRKNIVEGRRRRWSRRRRSANFTNSYREDDDNICGNVAGNEGKSDDEDYVDGDELGTLRAMKATSKHSHSTKYRGKRPSTESFDVKRNNGNNAAKSTIGHGATKTLNYQSDGDYSFSCSTSLSSWSSVFAGDNASIADRPSFPRGTTVVAAITTENSNQPRSNLPLKKRKFCSVLPTRPSVGTEMFPASLDLACSDAPQ